MMQPQSEAIDTFKEASFSDRRPLTLTPKISENSLYFSLSGSSKLNINSGQILVDRFPNGESRIEVHENVRDRQVFLHVEMHKAINETLVDTALSVQALKLAGASKVVVMLPYFPYSRQDRRSDIRPPISSKAVAEILSTMGADQIITVDLHARQVEGFFSGPFDNLEGLQHMVRPLLANEGNGLLVVSPDAGGTKRAEQFARNVESETGAFTPLVVMSKFRRGPGLDPEVTLSVDPEHINGKTCVLVDDMIDTGGSMIAASKALKEKGAARVVLCATHGIFSNNAISKLESATVKVADRELQAIDAVYVSDTIPSREASTAFLKRISLQPLLEEALVRVDNSKSSLAELNKRRDLGRQV